MSDHCLSRTEKKKQIVDVGNECHNDHCQKLLPLRALAAAAHVWTRAVSSVVCQARMLDALVSCYTVFF